MLAKKRAMSDLQTFLMALCGHFSSSLLLRERGYKIESPLAPGVVVPFTL